MTLSPNVICFDFFIGALIVLGLLWISLVDILTREIPDRAVLLLLGTGLLQLTNNKETELSHHFATGAMIFVLFWVAGECYYRYSGVDGLGMGDAKLFGAAAFLLGPLHLPDLILLSSLAGIVACFIVRWRSGKMPEGIPFGPFISYAILICYFQEPLFLGAYS